MASHNAAVQSSVSYLQSQAALQALDINVYWPKWDGPWWHMLLLHEMGHTTLIPQAAIDSLVKNLNALRLKIFPIYPADMPDGPDLTSPCHCQIGTLYQVLATRGVDVDRELPWMRTWFSKYQMADGGFNCDEGAYLVKDECPSSMVGTIGIFEAMVLHVANWTAEEEKVVEKIAQFMLERQLRLGSTTRYNADERVSAEAWTKLTFPRFYLYDVLRGLSALTHWAVRTKRPLPAAAIQSVVDNLMATFPDDKVSIGRQGFANKRTRVPLADGTWASPQPAALHPLLTAVSQIGDESPYLSRQWRETKSRLVALGMRV